MADQILSRIFDQRQFTGGEINFLVRELDEKVDLTENFDKLLKINENVCVISDTSREDMCSAHDATMQKLSNQGESLPTELQVVGPNRSPSCQLSAILTQNNNIFEIDNNKWNRLWTGQNQY